MLHVLIDFSLTVKAATLKFISGCGSAISSAKQGKSGSIRTNQLFGPRTCVHLMKIQTIYTLN